MDVTKQNKRVLYWVVAANLTIAAVKIVLGVQIGSASLTADGFHSVTDGISNFIGLLGITLAARPKDTGHPYGHKKYECLTGLAISVMLFYIAAQISTDAVRRWGQPNSLQISGMDMLLLIVSLIINIVVCISEYRAGKRLNSYILISDSLHTKSDIYVSAGVIVTLWLVKLGVTPFIDTVVSLAVAVLILHAAYTVGKSTISVLVDSAIIDVDAVRNIALNFPTVLDVHKIRSRGSANDMYLDMHIVIQADLSLKEAHKLVHSIEASLKQAISPNLQVLIHVEPYIERAICWNGYLSEASNKL